MRQVHRQPRLGRRRWQRAGQLNVVLEHLVGGPGIAQTLPEQVNAHGVPAVQERHRGGQGLASRSAGDVTRRGTPRRRLTQGHGLDGALQPLARCQTKQHYAISPTTLSVSPAAVADGGSRKGIDNRTLPTAIATAQHGGRPVSLNQPAANAALRVDRELLTQVRHCVNSE